MKMDPFRGIYGEKLTLGNIIALFFRNYLALLDKLYNKIDFFCRFSYVAICCLSLLRCLDKLNVEKAVNYIVSCKNLDGGFGCTPGAESHAGQSMYILDVDYHVIMVQHCKYILRKPHGKLSTICIWTPLNLTEKVSTI